MSVALLSAGLTPDRCGSCGEEVGTDCNHHHPNYGGLALLQKRGSHPLYVFTFEPVCLVCAQRPDVRLCQALHSIGMEYRAPPEGVWAGSQERAYCCADAHRDRPQLEFFFSDPAPPSFFINPAYVAPSHDSASDEPVLPPMPAPPRRSPTRSRRRPLSHPRPPRAGAKRRLHFVEDK